MSDQSPPDIPVPFAWAKNVRSAVLHVISLAHYAIVAARGWAANSINARVRLAADNDRLKQDNQLLREELRIKDTRLAKIDPRHRPYYPPTERMAILELKAAQGWSLAQTAKVFLIEPDTVASWLKRIDEDGSSALVQLREPFNKFPDFVRYIVQRLKILCPALGKVKIAQILARAGLHLGVTTVGRMLKAKDKKAPPSKSEFAATAADSLPSERVVTAKRPNHVWHVDLTAVPLSGFWAPWLPFSRAVSHRRSWALITMVAAILNNLAMAKDGRAAPASAAAPAKVAASQPAGSQPASGATTEERLKRLEARQTWLEAALKLEKEVAQKWVADRPVIGPCPGRLGQERCRANHCRAAIW